MSKSPGTVAPGLDRLEFNGISVGILDVERLADPLGPIEFSDRSHLDSVALQSRRQNLDIPVPNLQREVVEIPPLWAGRRPPAQTERGRDIHEVDEATPRAQLDQTEIVEAAFFLAAEDPAVESNRGLQITNPEHEMVEAGNLKRHPPRLAPRPRTPADRISRIDFGMPFAQNSIHLLDQWGRPRLGQMNHVRGESHSKALGDSTPIPTQHVVEKN